MVDPAYWVTRILAICRTVTILGGIPRRSINRIHYLRLSSSTGIRRRFSATELRFSAVLAARRLAVVRGTSYVIMAD